MLTRIVLALSFATPALADQPTKSEPAPIVAEVTHDFEVDVVTGHWAQPFEEWIRVGSASEHASLIEVRTDFRDRLVADAEAL
jgi:hypothetical protein